MYIADNTDQSFKFNTLEDALVFVRECARYSPDIFYRVYEAKEIFNSNDLDKKAILEKEPIDTNKALSELSKIKGMFE